MSFIALISSTNTLDLWIFFLLRNYSFHRHFTPLSSKRNERMVNKRDVGYVLQKDILYNYDSFNLPTQVVLAFSIFNPGDDKHRVDMDW